jgi:hypothetical protein
MLFAAIPRERVAREHPELFRTLDIAPDDRGRILEKLAVCV